MLSSDPIPKPSLLTLGRSYSMDEIEEIFGSGGFYAGINPRTDEQDSLEYIVVTATDESHYDDDISGTRFQYIGHDSGTGDQPLGERNGRLIEQIRHLSVPIYFFSREGKGDPWTYGGLLDVIRHEYISEGGRKINRFTLERLGVPTAAALSSVEEGMDAEASDPPLKEPEEWRTTSTSPVRSDVFRRRVKAYYNFTCAICGACRFSPTGTTPEVEAAHIYPRRENGRDHYRNGMALCRLHHWAFDNGWLAVDDDYRIIVADAEHPEEDEFQRLAGKKLTLPKEEDKRPALKYIREHRKLHGFID